MATLGRIWSIQNIILFTKKSKCSDTFGHLYSKNSGNRCAYYNSVYLATDLWKAMHLITPRWSTSNRVTLFSHHISFTCILETDQTGVLRFCPNQTEHQKVTSTNTSHLEPNPGIYRLLMKRKLYIYVLLPLGKMLIS